MSSRIVGIDYGTKRIGMAVADPLHMFAQPVGSFSAEACVDKLQKVADEEGLERIVIGWPLTEAGEQGKSTHRVQQFVNRLKNALPGVDVVKQDERYTSEMAKEKLREAGLSHTREEKGRVDAAAAAIILQEYLDNEV